jgi:hypothetical protein
MQQDIYLAQFKKYLVRYLLPFNIFRRLKKRIIEFINDKSQVKCLDCCWFNVVISGTPASGWGWTDRSMVLMQDLIEYSPNPFFYIQDESSATLKN